MNKRPLTKADIDRVRNYEGFPIATDEEIIRLSDAPCFTACPNPFIEEFVKEYGSPYDENTDTYNREPFASDISEGKSDPLYMAHSYHTKVPYKAIKRYILHYTKPGDIVLDAFCGTGMTGVAAQDCKSANAESFSLFNPDDYSSIGARKVILNDLSPVATFIAYNCNKEVRAHELSVEIDRWLHETEREVGWVYETKHIDGNSARIGYTVWSQEVICPSCGKSVLFYDLVTAEGAKSKDRTAVCPHCKAIIEKSSLQRSVMPAIDTFCNQQSDVVVKRPIKLFYSYQGKTYEKKPDDFDYQLLDKIMTADCSWVPTDRMMEGNESRRNDKFGITHVHHFFSKRNLIVLAKLYEKAAGHKYNSIMRELIIASLARASVRNRYIPEYGNRHVGTLSGTLYVPPISEENNLLDAIRGRANKVIRACAQMQNYDNDYIISTGSVTQLPVPSNSVDYIFTDPPFGDNLIYSELNYISESWLKVFTNIKPESIICDTQGKGLNEYNELMRKGFTEYFRVLKPNRWITVEFHNSQNAVWNGIQEALQASGFIVADVRVLDKQKGTTKQLSYSMAVKQDLVISAYKPKDSFRKRFIQMSGSEETAWVFVRQHLCNLPIAVKKAGAMEIISERQAFLLWDRMVAYHIMQGIAVPLDATAFYKGLDERFLKRDNMYFLPDQVNEYDMARSTCDVENLQFSLFVSDEKSAIGWLYQQLDETSGAGPQTYAELMPKFMQELKAVDKHEKMPELAVILEENFLKDENGRWYIPDLTKSGDLALLREKNLLKEFRSYQQSKGKLKVFRSEAIRVGFAHLWKEKDYAAIVAMAERLPEQTIQEDSSLLMYYDISLSRV